MTAKMRRIAFALLCALLVVQCVEARSRRVRRGDELKYKCWVLEDGEDKKADGWTLWGDDSPANVRNAADPEDAKNRVIQLVTGRDSCYTLDLDRPNDSGCVVQWRMWLEDTFYDYVKCETSEGIIHVRYVPGPCDGVPVGKEPTVGLDLDIRPNRWITVRRDVLADLRTLYPDIKLLSIQGVKFRGARYVDDIRIYDYKDEDHDLLPDQFEESHEMDPKNPDDAKQRHIEKVIELTDSPDGKAKEEEEEESEKDRPREEPEKKESKRDKARRYRVALSEKEREDVWSYFETQFEKRLSQAPRPEIGRMYRVQMREGGTIMGQLEKFGEGRIALRTTHGSLVLPIHRVSRRDTVALFPREAARQMAMRDVQKRVDSIIEEKVERAEKAAVSSAGTSAVAPNAAARAADLFGAPATGVEEPEVMEDLPAPAPAAEGPVAERPVFRTTQVERPTYDVRPTPTPEEIRPALQAFGEWLQGQHRRVGGRIANRIYAKEQSGNAVLYLVMDAAFLEQDYDLRHRMAVGIQQFWAFRCQGMGVSDLSSAHLVMVGPQGRIVGGSRPEDPVDIWVAE